jgi:hypothetical protein
LESNPRLGRKPAAYAARVSLIDMDNPYIYEIRLEGHLTNQWAEWFEELTIYNEANGETILTGKLIDQAALYGVLNKIHNLNLSLISVCRLCAA